MNNKTDKKSSPRSENLQDLQDFAVAAKDEHRANSFALSRQSSADEVSAAQQEDVFSDLQSLWDEQSRRIDQLLAEHPASQPRALNFRRYKPWRRRVMVECLALAVLNIAAGLYTLASFLPDPYILIRVTGYVLASTNALMAFHSLYTLLSFRRHHPARVATSRMSRFIRRMHMEPHYAPHPDRRKSRVIRVDFRNAVATAFSSARQVAAVSAAAMVVFVFVACTPVGDGLAMSKSDRANRAAAIVNVDEMVAQI